MSSITPTDVHSLSLFEGLKGAGHALRIAFDRSRILGALEYAGSLGDRVSLRMGRENLLLIQHPEDYRAVLMAPETLMTTSHLQSKPLSIRSEGTRLITNTTGSEWKSQKVSLSRFLGASGASRGTPAAAEQDIAAHISTWDAQPNIAVAQESSRLALKYMFAGIFNSHATTQECDNIHAASSKMHDYLFWSIMTLGRFPKDAIKKFTEVKEATAAYDHSIDRLLSEYEALPPEERAKSLLSRVLPEDWQGKGRAQAVSTISEIMIASHLSIRTTYYWAMHHLARNPQIQARIRDEAKKPQTAQCPYPAAASGNDISTAEKMALEITRLYPPFYLFLKEAAQDFKGHNGFNIEKGTTILLAPWLTHRDPRWFSEPQKFDPELHFSAAARHDRDDFAHIPFGKGPHKCIGENMAMQQLISTLSQICSRYELSPVGGEALPEINADVFLKPEDNSRLALQAL